MLPTYKALSLLRLLSLSDRAFSAQVLSHALYPRSTRSWQLTMLASWLHRGLPGPAFPFPLRWEDQRVVESASIRPWPGSRAQSTNRRFDTALRGPPLAAAVRADVILFAGGWEGGRCGGRVVPSCDRATAGVRGLGFPCRPLRPPAGTRQREPSLKLAPTGERGRPPRQPGSPARPGLSARQTGGVGRGKGRGGTGRPLAWRRGRRRRGRRERGSQFPLAR